MTRVKHRLTFQQIWRHWRIKKSTKNGNFCWILVTNNRNETEYFSWAYQSSHKNEKFLLLLSILEHYHLFNIIRYKCLFSDGNTERILIANFKIGNGNYYSATFMTSLNKIA